MLCAAAPFPNLACSGILTVSCGLPSICGATSHVQLWGGGRRGSGEDRAALHCYALPTSQNHFCDPSSQATCKERHKLASAAQG